MDKGSYCAMFSADTEQNCDTSPESLQSKYKAKGSSQMQKMGAYIHGQTLTLVVEEYRKIQEATTLIYLFAMSL